MGGFLADDGGFGQQAGQHVRQDLLAFVVGHGHRVVRRLGDDLVAGQRLVVRQDRALRRLAHDRLDRLAQAHER